VQPRSLTVLYDDACGFCRWCCHWLASQPQLVPLQFVAGRSALAAARFPGLSASIGEDELAVIDDAGNVYTDWAAWIMCLYALDGYRSWAQWLAEPPHRHLARRAFAWLGGHRGSLSKILVGPPHDDIASQLSARPEPPRCVERASAGGGASDAILE
jgi:predicted DCC family thiol-disulfide oxidoreductase YuxK